MFEMHCNLKTKKGPLQSAHGFHFILRFDENYPVKVCVRSFYFCLFTFCLCCFALRPRQLTSAPQYRTRMCFRTNMARRITSASICWCVCLWFCFLYCVPIHVLVWFGLQQDGEFKDDKTHQQTGWSSAFTVQSLLIQLQGMVYLCVCLVLCFVFVLCSYRFVLCFVSLPAGREPPRC